MQKVYKLIALSLLCSFGISTAQAQLPSADSLKAAAAQAGTQVDAAKAQANQAATNVNSGCTADAQTAGCPNATVQTGLVKCLVKYKKKHKDYNFSESCKATMQAAHANQ